MKVAKLSNVQKIIWNACHPLEIPLLTSVGSICPYCHSIAATTYTLNTAIFKGIASRRRQYQTSRLNAINTRTNPTVQGRKYFK